MLKLKAEYQPLLTENELKILTQNRICTLLDFLQEDTEKLSILTQLTLPQILEIRNNILQKYSAKPINGTELYIKSFTKKNRIQTGIAGLDAILDTGIPIGSISEICGLAGSGKTQLCMQIAINCVKNSDYTILYIDTKGDFSALRIQKILDCNGYSHKEMALIMLKIRVVRVWTIEDLIEFIYKIKTGFVVIENLALVIIDSLPCLLFQHFGDNNKMGLHFLNRLVLLLKYLNKELDIGVICVNIYTRWIDQNIPECDDGESNKESNHIEKVNRCLGKYWQNIPEILLNIQRCQDAVENNILNIKISVTNCKNPLFVKSCMLTISGLGVR